MLTVQFFRVILAATLLALLAPSLPAQGTQADYDRAKNLRRLTENKVFRDHVQPHWLPGNTSFWYQVKTGPDTHEYVFVDAEKGVRQPAFDHVRLAKAIAGAGVKDAQPDRLPLEKLAFKSENNAMQFVSGGKSWRCDLQSYAVTPQSAQAEAAAPLPSRDVPRASTRTGAETSLLFVNRTQAEVELFWVDGEGERHSYGKIAAGQQRTQHTYSGHVWLALDGAGKTVASFQADDGAGRAEITGETAKSAPPKTEPSRPRRSSRDTSPNGRWRAFLKDYNLMAKNVESGEEFALSSDGTADDSYSDRVDWSPDSRKLVAIRTRKAEDHKVYLIESSPRDQVQPKLQSYDYLKPGDKIAMPKPQLFDVEKHKQISVNDALFPNPWSVSDVRWERDSSRFTFYYNQRGHQVLRIIAVDASTGESRPIIDEQSPTFIDYAGKHFVQYLDDTSEIIWMSERDGWNHLYLFDARSTKVKHQITRGEWVVRNVERVDEQKRQIWFRAGGIRPGQDPYLLHYCRVNFDGSGLTVLTEGDGNHSLEYSPDLRFYIDTFSRVDLPPVNELRRTEDGQLVCLLEKADWSKLLAAGWRIPEPFVAKGRDGATDIYGVIMRPTNFDPKKKYPVIENIYAGPQSAFTPKNFRALHGMQELAELGFIVVQMDGMGTSQRSKKFHDVCWKNLGDAGFPDRILWLQAAAQKYPFMDLSRVGLYGTSAGGQSALRGLLAHGDFYKAGVADCGCHDNRMDKIWWNELWMCYPVGPHYEEQSNVTQAHKLQGKLLLMVGEMDRNVDPASTMQVVNALIKADKDFELLVVPGAGHGVAGSAYGKRRLQDFFVRSLLGVEPRAGSNAL